MDDGSENSSSSDNTQKVVPPLRLKVPSQSKPEDLSVSRPPIKLKVSGGTIQQNLEVPPLRVKVPSFQGQASQDVSSTGEVPPLRLKVPPAANLDYHSPPSKPDEVPPLRLKVPSLGGSSHQSSHSEEVPPLRLKVPSLKQPSGGVDKKGRVIERLALKLKVSAGVIVPPEESSSEDSSTTAERRDSGGSSDVTVGASPHQDDPGVESGKSSGTEPASLPSPPASTPAAATPLDSSLAGDHSARLGSVAEDSATCSMEEESLDTPQMTAGEDEAPETEAQEGGGEGRAPEQRPGDDSCTNDGASGGGGDEKPEAPLTMNAALQRVKASLTAEEDDQSRGGASSAADSEDNVPLENLRQTLLDRVLPPDESSRDTSDETPGRSSAKSTPSTKLKKKRSSRVGIKTTQLGPDQLSADGLQDYLWPQEGAGDWYMLQEQVCTFLGLTSFKRRYPDLVRRQLEVQERIYLRDRGLVTDTQCDLGLTALRSDEVQDLLAKDFPDKFTEYTNAQAARQKQLLLKRQQESAQQAQKESMGRDRLASQMKRAVKAAADYNSGLNRERRHERRCYWDLQTMEVHFPHSTHYVLPPESTRPSEYPVPVIPGQFGEHYRRHTPTELRYMPMKTATYTPPKRRGSLEDLLASDVSDSEEDSIFLPSDSEAGDKKGGEEGTPAGEGEVQEGEAPEAEPQGPLCKLCRKPDLSGGADAELHRSLVQCSECQLHVHPLCLELPAEMTPIIRDYAWQCMECKKCNHCSQPSDEDKMMFCDRCDRGYHTFCVGLEELPTGKWECPLCAPPKPKDEDSSSVFPSFSSKAVTAVSSSTRGKRGRGGTPGSGGRGRKKRPAAVDAAAESPQPASPGGARKRRRRLLDSPGGSTDSTPVPSPAGKGAKK